MLKRFVGTKSGKKQNKSGVILVTILFILAVAFVLIGAALVMTANTRKRLYSFAEGGQARITCTAAAQLFQSALEEQQIRDSQFKDLCDAGTVVYFTDTSVPGMGGTPTTSPNNYTQAKFGKSGTLYTVRVTTRIGDEVENILLTYQGTIPTVTPSPFAFQVELGEGGRLDNVKIGANIAGTARVNNDDNVIVTRGDGTAPVGSCDFYSTFVTTTAMRSASGTHYYSDVVFAGDNSGVSMNGGGTGSGADMTGGGTCYFINSDKIIWGTASADQTHEMFTSDGSHNAQIVFCNVDSIGVPAMFQSFNNFGDNHIYRVNRSAEGALSYTGSLAITDGSNANSFSTGTSIANSAVTGKTLDYYIGNLDQYLDPNYIDPSTSTARPSCFQDFNLPQTSGGYQEIIQCDNFGNPTDAASVPALHSGANSGNRFIISGTITGSSYEVDCSSQNVIIYVTGDLHFGNGGCIRVNGGDGTNTGHRCYIILKQGVTIDFDATSAGDCGIFSTNVSGPSGIDQSQAPSTYIIGAGLGTRTGCDAHNDNHGQISFNTSVVGTIEAMIALYPNTDTSDDGGDIYIYEATKGHIYGRVIAHTIWADTGSHAVIPYCPQFSTGDNPNALYPVTTNFTLKDFDYYYDDGSTHVLSTAPSST